MRGLYTLAVKAYAAAVRAAAWLGHPKARLWAEGRRPTAQGQAHSVSTDRHAQTGTAERWVWFHAASLGEFEQGRPLIEALKAQHPELKVCLSFFSPSGYEVRKDYPLADEVCYLPVDTPRNAHAWVQRHPYVAAFFIKYEFWFNYMQALHEAGIPLYYVSLLLRLQQYFFRWYGGWFRKQLGLVSHFFVQDEATLELLKGIGLNNATVCGDTRFDRVAAIARQAKPFPEVEAFLQGRHCIVAGSTWPPDEKLLIPYIERLPHDYCMILAPHDVGEHHVKQITEQLRQTLSDDFQRYTDLHPERKSRVLVLDTIGILSQLYQYARFVYIGGGFGANIHNIQEPVTFGCPVVFGPRHKTFKEAVDLAALGGAFPIDSQAALDQVFDRLVHDEPFRQKASAVCRDYLATQLGATQKIMDRITSTFSA